ncbi:helix-turn-helix domain-containing protein [Marinomonas sp. 2405UD68-3]|uniref:helix-turn-helix domain-containing protein n=1 Tax=Marinomonas sp. 2405UD68-3 TaxID=3391835 RepID=UPI0039C93D37
MKALIYGLTPPEEHDVSLLLNFMGIDTTLFEEEITNSDFAVVGSLNSSNIHSTIPVIYLSPTNEFTVSAPNFWRLPLPWTHEDVKPILQRLTQWSRSPAINVVDLNLHVKRLESLLIRQALTVANGVVSRAAQHLQIQRTTLIEKMRRYNIDKSEF